MIRLPDFFTRLHGASLAVSSRACLLAQARLLPLAAVVILVPAQIQAFRTYEAGGPETAGVLLFIVAGSGFLLCLNGMRRAASAWSDTVRVMNQWRATATPLSAATRWRGRAWAIQSTFPVVALAGVLRPQLFIARQVLSRCTPAELAAISAHEAAHAAARDNLIRLLFELTPGVGLFRRVAEPLEQAWAAASEEAADLVSVATSSRLDLASALTKVARLAGEPSSHICASALIGGTDLTSRILRLLGPHVPERQHPFVWIPVVAMIGAALVLYDGPLSADVHELFEWLVRRS
jgi:Zn-dependent protease with chaperone function